jgi:hypothetical protein
MKAIILREYFKVVLFLLVSFLFLFSVTSCSARKHSKSTTEEVVKTENSDNSTLAKKEENNSEVKSITKVDDKAKTVKKEIILKPIDPTKPSSATTPDGKKYDLNNAEVNITETEENNNRNLWNSQNSQNSNLSQSLAKANLQSTTESVKETSDLKTEREARSIFDFWWLWLIAAGILLWIFKAPIIHWFLAFKRT